MDLSNLSYAELNDLQTKIASELKVREVQEKENLRQEIMAKIAACGFSLEEVMPSGKKIRSAGQKVAVKYRHPQDASLEWSGRGRKPQWVVAWIEGGNALESLLIG